ncbi:MAG TPA: aminomethyl-transferring glycine dehydrogenase subunit GcvPA [Candidatus Mailhella excrementigallinarum]|nr:aminomethyl-transferring glycine dehydrogenase subunit GcvPA [Candidatus Mailhella excrementigallinarum]
MPYIPHTEEETRAMLDIVGVRTLDDLFADISPDMRPKSFSLPAGLSEMEVCSRLDSLAAANHTNVVSFLGAGFYDHHIPKAVDTLSSRGEFLTAYTPYQPEVSQGTLQAIFEFQTAVCRLLDMDAANASVYDGGSALFEAGMMAFRQTRRRKLVIDECVNPIWRVMLSTYTANQHCEIVIVPHKNGTSDKAALKAAVDRDCAAVMVQNPGFFGSLDDYTELFTHARSQGALGVISVYPVMQSVLKTPGEMGADIAVADGQELGMPLSFGGPYLGLMACRRELVRQMPGRIAGRTHDVDGKTGYVLTLQAREQHIRRSKATSNICSNQALCALRALIHMSLLGPEGLSRTAELGMENLRRALDRLTSIPGVTMLNDAPFGNEAAIVLPMSAYELADRLTRKGYVPGFPVGNYYKNMDNVLLVACTEKHSREQIGILCEMMASELRGGM